MFHTPLLAREPGTHDYELARALLGRQFPHGHTARALLDMYRDHTLDLSVETVIAGIGASTRLVITTSFTTPAADPVLGLRHHRESASSAPQSR